MPPSMESATPATYKAAPALSDTISRGSDGFGITVSYWASEAAIAAWKHQAEHAATRNHGRKHWYEHFELRVAKVERAYGKPTKG